MTDAFAALVYPIVRHVVDVLHHLDHGDPPSLTSLKKQLVDFLDAADQKASLSAPLSHDWEFAKQALVYWIDETLINSKWGHADEWRQHILEWDLYRERLRAIRFYEKATEAAAFSSTDPLEVFFLCVALGFRGQYAEGSAGLRKWGERVHGRITAGSKQPDRFLPDEPRDPDGPELRPLPGKAILLEISIAVSITALVTLACFLVASLRSMS